MLHPLKSSRSSKLSGTVTVPGDKSISHRSLMLASQAIGTSHICGLLEGDDVIATADALRKLGVNVTRQENGDWVVEGVGVGGLSEAEDVLDMGNAGTGTRLMMGLVATYPYTTIFTGDNSLKSRPMARITKPLEQMGVEFEAREGCRLPLSVKGTSDIMPIEYEQEVASAQVKSAILLAGLNTAGVTTVIEPVPTRDHTELMLKGFGADIEVIENKDGSRRISINGHPDLRAMDIKVPGDPSSAAFLVVAALIIPDSDIVIENICVNPLRTGLYATLKEMGAEIEFTNERVQAGEKVADLRVKYSQLKGITVPASRAPSMIDEYPILAVAASVASGKTTMLGLEELKVKESNRLQAIADGLEVSGVEFDLGADSLTVTGGDVKGGGKVKTHLDHRIAMAFLILGMVAKEPVIVDDGNMINTSFPGFVDLVNGIGGKISDV